MSWDVSQCTKAGRIVVVAVHLDGFLDIVVFVVLFLALLARRSTKLSSSTMMKGDFLCGSIKYSRTDAWSCSVRAHYYSVMEKLGLVAAEGICCCLACPKGTTMLAAATPTAVAVFTTSEKNRCFTLEVCRQETCRLQKYLHGQLVPHETRYRSCKSAVTEVVSAR
jgi:hypothetical protein